MPRSLDRHCRARALAEDSFRLERGYNKLVLAGFQPRLAALRSTSGPPKVTGGGRFAGDEHRPSLASSGSTPKAGTLFSE